MRQNKIIFKNIDFTVIIDLTQSRTFRSMAGYVSFVSQLTRGIDPMAD